MTTAKLTPNQTDGSDADRAARRSAVPRATPSVFTVPLGLPFLQAFANAVLNGDLPRAGGAKPRPIDLPGMTILLPTTRAARALQEAFLTAADGKAMLLPKIRPIAEGEEDVNLLYGLAALDGLRGLDERAASVMADIAPAVSELERRLILTQMVLAWSKAQRGDALGIEPVMGGGAATPAQAAKLAAELASLIDTIETENVSLTGLQDLVPEYFEAHWQQTLQFLKIVTQFWPAHLKERGLSSASHRRNRLILAQAAQLAAQPPAGPVIVAGVTGSIPATGELMKVVASLEQGAIVLPALDKDLDEPGWQAISGGETVTENRRAAARSSSAQSAMPESTAQSPQDHPEHPQFRLKKLLELLGLTRGDVALLPGCSKTPSTTARAALVSEAMRPAAATDHWHDFVAKANKDAIRAGLAGINLLEVPSAQDEAETIALILREAAETPGKTAALISPDRLLARRVAIRLESWGIRVDDSAGRPFAKTVPGAFLDLVITAAAEDFAPASLMSLLKHPLTRLGMPTAAIRRAGRALELAAFRAPYLGQGLDGVDSALERAKQAVDEGRRRGRAVRRLWDDDWTAARDLVMALKAAFAPLEPLFADDQPHELRDLANAHIAVAEALSLRPDESDPTALWHGEAGESASLFFAGLMDADMPAPKISARDYPDFYRALIVGQNVLSKIPVHPRLSIWGLFEARLQQADVMILGALNETTWPKSADPGPWLNRPMRRQLGLPSPEQAIGSMAHDFTSFLGAHKVYLTRATKVDGVPTVPSRWLMRLGALLDGMGLKDALLTGQPWSAWARHRDAAPPRIQLQAPEPRPPVALRPRAMSVTAIEKWIANPYAIFASRILNLDPLPSLGGEPDAGLRGSVIHEALSRFTLQYKDQLPDDVAAALMEIAGEVLADYKAHPRVAAFWLPRLQRFAQWFADKEPLWRQGIAQRLVEIDGSQIIDAPAGPFTLTARADRFDVAAIDTTTGDTGNDELIITDYKTGQVPNNKQVLSGAAPQLPLEAAIAEAGGFAHLAAVTVIGLRYVRATGAEPPGKEVMVKSDDLSALAQAALKGLKTLVAEFDDEATPYKALRRGAFQYRYDDYAHLARVAEWSGPADEELGS